MTLKEYADDINNLLKDNPEFADFPVIYSADDEGNSYQNVNYTPSPVEVEDPLSYYHELVWEEDGETEGQNFNAIIIN